MGTVSQASPERMYSWWWVSHISPKQSKWLQENLTDMDTKVKQMIKLIEEDADSFARRAEMYYKKRPELMKLVEDFYRAYRALAERYDHMTLVLRQAHRTMADVFPNQVPFVFMDDVPAVLPNEVHPSSPGKSQMGVTFDICKMQKDVMPLSPPELLADRSTGASFELSDSEDGAKCMKSVERRARKALNFQDADIKELGEPNNVIDNLKAQVSSESERVGKAEVEISTLKFALSKLEAEKEVGLLEHQKSLEKLSNLELEVSCAKLESKGLNERASKAEAEVQTLKNSLEKLEAERHTSLLQYQQCAEKILNMENYISQSQKTAGELDERASKAETEVQSVTHSLARLEAEKEYSLVMYDQCLEKISDMEGKLQHATDTARSSNKRADKADKEVETLMQTLSRLVEEKKTAAVKYNNCLETIAFLEHKLMVAQEDAKRLNSEINDGVAKFKGAEERCLHLEILNQTMKYSLEELTEKTAAQREELTQKQKEMDKLWTNFQEEHLRFMEADTSLRTLQCLLSQSQEEHQSILEELQNRAARLQELEAMNRSFQLEVGQTKVENKNLNEVNLSLALTVQDLKAETLCLKEKIVKLEAEIEVQVDHKTALQEEIHRLKEELSCLFMTHRALMEQVDSLGFDPDGFVSCVKELQDENIKLKQVFGKEREEKVVFPDMSVGMDMHIKRNASVEESSSKLELEGVRGKLKKLADSCLSLQEEKSALFSEKSLLASQLQVATDDLENISQKKKFLEKPHLEANSELECLRSTSKRCVESDPSHVEINQLKERVYALDAENGELKAQMIAYATAFFSLRDCVTTLEQTSTLQVLHEIDAKEAKDVVSTTCARSHQQMSEQQDAMLPGGFLDLKGLQQRIKDIEKAMVEKDEHLLQEISMASSKLEAAMRQIKDLKSRSCVNCQPVRKEKNIDHKVEEEQLRKGSCKDVRMQKETREISEEGNEERIKEIMLDDTSECSSIGFSRRDLVETNNPTFEVWETAFRNGSIDMTVEKAQKVTRTWAEKKHYREHRIRKTQSFAESEGSGRLSSSRHLVNERRIQERLDSDVQKLTNLLITVQDLKKTVELTERSKKGKDTEYDIVKEQLDESEEAITKLFNASLRLKRTVQEVSLSENSAIALDEGESIRRRKISEQARRVSEKVRRLQLVVQKLQFLLLKLDDHNKTRPRIKIAERKTRILLRDYLNSGTRTRQRPKKGHFCACAQPSTTED